MSVTIVGDSIHSKKLDETFRRVSTVGSVNGVLGTARVTAPYAAAFTPYPTPFGNVPSGAGFGVKEPLGPVFPQQINLPLI